MTVIPTAGALFVPVTVPEMLEAAASCTVVRFSGWLSLTESAVLPVWVGVLPYHCSR